MTGSDTPDCPRCVTDHGASSRGPQSTPVGERIVYHCHGCGVGFYVDGGETEVYDA